MADAKYEICPTLADADAKLAKINLLLGYPNGATTYRPNFLHPAAEPEDLRAIGLVDDKLVTACAEMTAEERLEYYNEENLYTLLEVHNEGWFPA
ncbi:unnamed protein product [marine sediment metagenome]|uniref:Uncharacterized protein n=1 Tax=marine sediment metagenome TaxID=412755 RepID=X0V2T3_9ZZZZ